MPSDLDVVRRLLQTNRSGPAEETTEAAIELSADDLRFVSRVIAVEGAEYRGHAGIQQYFDDMTDAWQEWRNETVAVEELGAGVVLAEFTFRAVSRSGVAMELPGAGLFTLAAGKVTRCHIYATRAEALEAAGNT